MPVKHRVGHRLAGLCEAGAQLIFTEGINSKSENLGERGRVRVGEKDRFERCGLNHESIGKVIASWISGAFLRLRWEFPHKHSQEKIHIISFQDVSDKHILRYFRPTPSGKNPYYFI